jgi:hypothetical protein
MDSILSNINTFISNNTSLNLDSLLDSESEDNTQTFQYPNYSSSQQSKINSLNSYIGVNCCMGKMNVSNDGNISSVSCNMNVPTDYSNTLSAQQSSSSPNTIETFTNYNKTNKLNIYFICVLILLFILFIS